MLETVRTIPYGELWTYGDVAAAAGTRRAGRAAGSALARCPIELFVPCHRVVRAGPSLGSYGRHDDRRRFLLRLEERSRAFAAAVRRWRDDPSDRRARPTRCAAGMAGATRRPRTRGLDTTFGAQMASTWHYVGAPQRVQIGVFANDAQGLRTVTQGDVAFSFLGEGDPVPGPTATAFVPVPGSTAEGDTPTITAGGRCLRGRGHLVRPAGPLARHRDLEIDGVARSSRPTSRRRRVPDPAPGMPALATETLTNDSNVRIGAIDSMADGEGEVPDPELHEITIADAIDQVARARAVRDAGLLQSRSAGRGDGAQRLAADHQDQAVYIHVEIWKDFNASRR